MRRVRDRMVFLQDAGDTEWPGWNGGRAFSFSARALLGIGLWQVNRGAPRRLHQMIGEREEAAYGERASEIAAGLARHFTQGRDFERAFSYRHQAAHNALRASAAREAVEHLPRRSTPSAVSHWHSEAGARVATATRDGRARGQATRGYGAPEVQQAYQRAGELCQRLGETRATVFPR